MICSKTFELYVMDKAKTNKILEVSDITAIMNEFGLDFSDLFDDRTVQTFSENKTTFMFIKMNSIDNLLWSIGYIDSFFKLNKFESVSIFSIDGGYTYGINTIPKYMVENYNDNKLRYCVDIDNIDIKGFVYRNDEFSIILEANTTDDNIIEMEYGYDSAINITTSPDQKIINIAVSKEKNIYTYSL